MRKLFLTLSFAVISLWLFGQNENPYSQFGYEAPIMPDKQKRIEDCSAFIIPNYDVTSKVAYLSVDTKTRSILKYSTQGELLNVDSLSIYSMSRWLTTDPHGQFASPYLGMGNNPINGFDPDGRDVIILIDRQGANVAGNFNAGHMAMAITNEEGNWTFYSKNGRRDGSVLQGGHSKQQILKNVTWEQLKEIHPGYDEAIYIETTSDQDELMRGEADKQVKSYYHVKNNNCGHAVGNTLKIAGLDNGDRGALFRGSYTFMPNMRFEFMFVYNIKNGAEKFNIGTKTPVVTAGPAVITGWGVE